MYSSIQSCWWEVWCQCNFHSFINCSAFRLWKYLEFLLKLHNDAFRYGEFFVVLFFVLSILCDISTWRLVSSSVWKHLFLLFTSYFLLFYLFSLSGFPTTGCCNFQILPPFYSFLKFTICLSFRFKFLDVYLKYFIF